jgi:phage tail-like protein
MAELPSAQAASYPLAAWNFRVTVAGTTMRFARVTGLQREHQVQTYRHGFSFQEGEQIVKYFVDKFAPLTLEQGTVAGAAFLHTWLETGKTCAMEVQLCDAQGAARVAWRVNKAIPVKLSAPAFDAKTNEVAIESLELRAAGITVVDL